MPCICTLIYITRSPALVSARGRLVAVATATTLDSCGALGSEILRISVDGHIGVASGIWILYTCYHICHLHLRYLQRCREPSDSELIRQSSSSECLDVASLSLLNTYPSSLTVRRHILIHIYIRPSSKRS